jgi:hypothetical protein
MNAGKPIADVARELKRQIETRKDFLAPQGRLTMGMKGSDVRMFGLDGPHGLNIRQLAHEQIGETVAIPRKYYDRMLMEAPDLLALNVNRWFEKDKSTKRMVRTLDGFARAFLSERFRPLDNVDLMGALLPVIEKKGAQVMSSELTDKRLYVKAILPSMEAKIATSKEVGDIVSAGICVSNSEVGCGALRIEPFVYRLSCKNGLIVPDMALRKYHVGKGADADGLGRLLTTEAKRADDKAFWLRVRDITNAAFDVDVFKATVSKMNVAAGQEIKTDDLPAVVEIVTREEDIPERVSKLIEGNLIKGKDFTRWGLVNAVTAAANVESDYEVATHLERTGGKILDLSRSQWDYLACAGNN